MLKDVSQSIPPFDDELVEKLLSFPEGQTFEVKRVGDNAKKIKTITALANTDGGFLILGIEDSNKASGRDRVYGIQENRESIAELKQLLGHRIIPQINSPHSEPLSFFEIGCTLRDQSKGSILVVKVGKSYAVHSVVDGGTLIRVGDTNRYLNAGEITELSMQRGTTSAVNILADVPFALLDTIYWKEYRNHRKLTRDIDQALLHLGLARENEAGKLLPTRAAVLLFAEEPSGLLDTKCSIRIFHYRGETIEHTVDTNLLRTPKSVTGPLTVQIASARDLVVDSLAAGVQVGPLGFEIAQRYPVRVITEAITNAVIHRDYRLSSDIHIRIFANRIEIESPGILPGGVTTQNIGTNGSHPRNIALTNHLRAFPQAPNNDIGNAEVRKILPTADTIKAYKTISKWVKLGLLVVSNPTAAKQNRRYRLSGSPPDQGLLAKLLG